MKRRCSAWSATQPPLPPYFSSFPASPALPQPRFLVLHHSWRTLASGPLHWLFGLEHSSCREPHGSLSHFFQVLTQMSAPRGRVSTFQTDPFTAGTPPSLPGAPLSPFTFLWSTYGSLGYYIFICTLRSTRMSVPGGQGLCQSYCCTPVPRTVLGIRWTFPE